MGRSPWPTGSPSGWSSGTSASAAHEAGATELITPECDGRVRFSCFRIDAGHRRILCLREDMRDDDLEPVAAIVSLSLDGPNDDLGVELVAGRHRPRAGDDHPVGVDSPPDFLADPVVSPDGTRLAWVSWNHPRMAWDGGWLKVASLGPEGIDDVRVVAGAEDESVEQPTWLDDGRLVFLSDRTGWSNLYVWDGDEVTAVCPDDHDFGVPRWVPDLRSYVVLPGGGLATTRFVASRAQLCVVDPASGDLRRVRHAGHLGQRRRGARRAPGGVPGHLRRPIRRRRRHRRARRHHDPGRRRRTRHRRVAREPPGAA